MTPMPESFVWLTIAAFAISLAIGLLVGWLAQR